MEDTTQQTTTNTLATQHVIRYTLGGFPVETTCYGKVESLQGVIDKLRAVKAEPPLAAPVPTTAPAGKPDGDKKPPKYPVHQIPMKPSKKRGQSWFCPKQDGEGGYCEEYQ